MFPIQTITLSAPQYSTRLREIAKPPLKLFCRGDLGLLQHERLISIVGTRKATRYGLQVVHDAAAALVAAGFVTVSGLALGIDAAVHQETLTAGGKTIAVLGSSVEDGYISPYRHWRLAQQILQSGGLIVSEYPEDTPAYKAHFPARNRIIAGLSPATLIVEAAEKSGALITAYSALHENREVLAVPGSVYAPMSRGTNNLIARGAKPWLSCGSLLEELEYWRDEKCKYPSATPQEKEILALIEIEALTLDEIITQSQLPTAELIQIMNALELKGLIRAVGGQRYQAMS